MVLEGFEFRIQFELVDHGILKGMATNMLFNNRIY